MATSQSAVVVPRPGFQNRRNRSQYLKNLYPAGFGVGQARSELLLDPGPDLQPHHSTRNSLVLAPISFTRWTRGGGEDSSTIASLSVIDENEGDPYADCAGPTLKELAALKSMSSQRPLREISSDDPSCSISRCRIYTGKKAAVLEKKKVAVITPID